MHTNRKPLSHKIENIISKPEFSVKLLQYNDKDLHQITASIFTREENNLFTGFKSVKRKLEYYYTRLLWQEFYKNESISYNNIGRPILKSAFISISHSRDIIVIGLNNNNNIGIDVEYFSPKINAIKHKFISPADELLIDIKNEIHLTIVWSIKEAVYKMENIPGLCFKDNIHVKIADNVGYVDVVKNDEIHSYIFNFIIRENYVITFCSFGDIHNKSSF